MNETALDFIRRIYAEGLPSDKAIDLLAKRDYENFQRGREAGRGEGINIALRNIGKPEECPGCECGRIDVFFKCRGCGVVMEKKDGVISPVQTTISEQFRQNPAAMDRLMKALESVDLIGPGNKATWGDRIEALENRVRQLEAANKELQERIGPSIITVSYPPMHSGTSENP